MLFRHFGQGFLHNSSIHATELKEAQQDIKQAFFQSWLCFGLLKLNRIMSQKSILSFFKPPLANSGVKRAYDLNLSTSLPKKGKFEPESQSVDSNSGPGNCAEENRLKAMLKLQIKRTPALSSNIGLSWFRALEKEFKQPYFQELSTFIVKERESAVVYPSAADVFTWTRLCSIKDVKVVILGQDPYHGPGQAHGLAFSVPIGVKPPPSLINIFKELQNDIPGFEIPSHGYLKGWAVQGVLLLNTCLTVIRNRPNSHSGHGWEELTGATIKWINNELQNVVFLLWGANAQKQRSQINEKKHLVLVSSHPSPFSVTRGFFGCRHFSASNEYLSRHNKTPIDWTYLPTE